MSLHDQLAFQRFYQQAQTYLHQGAFSDAQASLEQALLFTDSPQEVHALLAHLCLAQNTYPQGIRYCQQALQHKPDSATLWGLLGNLQRLNRDYHAALESYQQGQGAARTPQERARLIFNQSLCYLALGDYPRGFQAFLSKQVGDGAPPSPFGLKRWQGQELSTAHLLLHATEGLGDTLQWIRFVPDLQAQRLSLLCPLSLHRLLAASYPDLHLLAPDTTVSPQQDMLYAPLYTLPAYLGLQKKQVPGVVFPYLKIPAGKHNSPALSSTQFKLGLCWACNPASPTAARRSLPLTDLRFLLQGLQRLSGLQVYSLQWQGDDTLKALPNDLRPIDLMASVHDLADTAAQIASLDLIVSIDTATVHLAGALNKPCWLLLPFAHSWRWQAPANWYTQQQQFVQTQAGQWQNMLESVLDTLSDCLSNVDRYPPG